MAQNRIERLQVETLRGQEFFQDLVTRDAYFDDFDDRSSNYFRLSYDPSFILHGGKNLIGIRGNSDTMEINSQILIEALDSQGNLIKTQVYDLNDDAHNRVIAIDITPETPPGEVIVTLMGVATRAPNGAAIPPDWAGIVNFRWTRQFTAQPMSPNSSKIIYNQFSKPVIEIKEVLKPFYKLSYNPELSSSIGWPTASEYQNKTSSYTLSSSVNTLAQVSYKKAADRTYVTLAQPNTNLIDFGGFTKDMEGGILIVRQPSNPRPSSIAGYNAPPQYAETEQGDGLFEKSGLTNNVGAYVTGAYLTTITEVLSPFEARTNTPHTTFQGNTAAQYQEFEHYEFENSNFELIWSETPQSYSASPTGSSGEPLNTSYAHVTFNNLEPLTGDVTRVKCYMKNHQAPFDWVLASDNNIIPQELLYRKDFQKYRAPIGDFSKWGVAFGGINTLMTYWTTSCVGGTTPSMSLYQQQSSGENPPVEDNLRIGDNQQALALDGTQYWWLESKESASFFQDQWYELSFKAVSVKTQLPTWTPIPDPAPIVEPKCTIYMSGSAFTDGGDDYGKFIGMIEDTAVRKKHIELDDKDNFKEKGYKFIFKADGTEHGLPKFKIDSGVWHFWNISIKPWDRKGYTPGTFDVIFPTIKCNVAAYDSLDFKFEFYNDYGMISNYTAVIDKVPWKNELTATFTNVVANTVSGSSGSFGNISTTNIFGPLTMSNAVSFSGPVVAGGPITMSGPGLFGQLCTDSWITSGSIYFPCLPEASQSKLVNWDPVTGQLKVTSSAAMHGGGGGADQNLFETIAVAGQSNVVADTTTDTLTFAAGSNMSITTNAGTDTVTFNATDTNTNQLTIWKIDDGSGSPTDISHGETVVIAGGANITTSRAGNTVTISSTQAGTGGGVDEAYSFVIAASSSGATVGPATGNTVLSASSADTLVLKEGTGIRMESDVTNDTVTIHTIPCPGFATFSVDGSDPIYADPGNCKDNLTLVAGSNMNITNDVSADTITFDVVGGGGSGGSCCSTCRPMSADANVFAMCHGHDYHISTHEIQGCPVTYGFTKPSMNAEYQTAPYKSRYAEACWLQVNNWAGPISSMEQGVPYAAIFNTTGPPSEQPGDAQCCSDELWNRAGHGVKIQTSTKPVQTFIHQKGGGGFYSCTVGTGLRPIAGNNAGGLPNAFYLSFYHFEAVCNAGVYDDAASLGYYAGGIRKDCTDFANAVVYEVTSDKRLKEEITPTKLGISELLKIRVRDFYYKRTPIERRTRKRTGLIAQELEEVYPQAVGGDGYGDVDENPMTISYDDLVPLLIQSVQDQQKTIDKLNKRIEKLENK